MTTPATTPEPFRKMLSRAGKIGGKGGSHRDKTRAGHASAAKRLNRLADDAERAGNHADAKRFRDAAQKQERLAR